MNQQVALNWLQLPALPALPVVPPQAALPQVVSAVAPVVERTMSQFRDELFEYLPRG